MRVWLICGASPDGETADFPKAVVLTTVISYSYVYCLVLLTLHLKGVRARQEAVKSQIS